MNLIFTNHTLRYSLTILSCINYIGICTLFSTATFGKEMNQKKKKDVCDPRTCWYRASKKPADSAPPKETFSKTDSPAERAHRHPKIPRPSPRCEQEEDGWELFLCEMKFWK